MDPIADLLTRIRNAQLVSHTQTRAPFSKFKEELLKVLEKQGFIQKFEKKGKKTNRFLEITLKYKDKKPVVSGLKKISKPGQRIYIPFTKIKPVRGGYGTAIISTSKGLKSDKEARKEKLGGEIICEIW